MKSVHTFRTQPNIASYHHVYADVQWQRPRLRFQRVIVIPVPYLAHARDRDDLGEGPTQVELLTSRVLYRGHIIVGALMVLLLGISVKTDGTVICSPLQFLRHGKFFQSGNRLDTKR